MFTEIFVCCNNVCKKMIYKENADIQQACILIVFTAALKDSPHFGECIDNAKSFACSRFLLLMFYSLLVLVFKKKLHLGHWSIICSYVKRSTWRSINLTTRKIAISLERCVIHEKKFNCILKPRKFQRFIVAVTAYLQGTSSELQSINWNQKNSEFYVYSIN